jgi:aldose 1-epimerase
MIDPSARTLTAGDLRAVFLPGLGMLGASLRHRGEELLGRLDEIEAFARTGRTCGIPLLHPWANRLGSPRYQAAGREVLLDPASSLLHFTDDGLAMHGVPWSRLSWQVTGADPNTLKAQLEWTRGELLAVFPFPHRLEMVVALRPNSLTVETTLVADLAGPVPVSFGFHPCGKDYLALEPMTAPTNALATGRGLHLVEPEGRFQAVFRVGVDLLT